MQIPRLAIENYQFTVVVFLAFLILGIGAITTMPSSEDPSIDPPGATVIAVYPGTSPVDMESLVVEPLEESINQIEDIKEFVTEIEDGLAKLMIEFEHGVDVDEKFAEVQNRVNSARNELPADLADLEVIQWSIDQVTIMQIALVSPHHPYRELYEESRRIKRSLERIPGVRQVEILGHPQEIVSVALNLERMAAFGIPLEGMLQAVRGQNANLPGGSVKVGARRFNVQTTGPYQSLDDVRHTVVRAAGGELVYLKDIAQVDFGYEDHIYRTRYNSTRCVFLSVEQKSGSDIFYIAGEVKRKLEDFRTNLPEGMDLRLGFDQSENVARRVDAFSSSLVQGILLVGFAIFLAVGSRAALIVMVAIPTSFLIGIGIVYLMGYGLQQMTIAGLIIALGLLVDNAIVVTESADRFLELGLDGKEAAIRGGAQVAWPTTSSTVTTVLAFVPIVLMQDVTGDFIRSMPVTVIFTLLASLFVAITLTPLLASKLLRRGPARGRTKIYLQRFIRTRYRPLLDWVLRHPWITLSASGAMLVVSFLLTPLVGISFFPKAEKLQILINLELPRGSNLDATDAVTAYVESVLKQQPEVVSTMANVGRGNPLVYYNLFLIRNKPHVGQVFVIVDPARGRTVENLVLDLRREFDRAPSAHIRVKEFEQGPGVEAPIFIKIHGDNLETLRQLSEDVEEMIRSTPGTLYVENPSAVAGTDLQVHVDRDKAYMLGLSSAAIDLAVRTAVAGAPATTYRDNNGKAYDVVLRLPTSGTPSMEAFDHIYLTSATGSRIPLRQVAFLSFKAGHSMIHHYDLERTATVKSDVSGRSVDETTQEIIDKLEAYDWPPNYRYSVGGELESRQESFGGMAQAALIALIAIYGILVLQFRSFAQPFVIFSAIPMALIGSILALLFSGYSFSFMAFVGLTSLLGIVINDSILLVDYINLRRAEGVPFHDAIQEAGQTRFIPVVLTSVTTIGGLLPLTFQGGTMWAPMGWTIIGGLFTSTLLTLLLVPVLYMLFLSGASPSALPRKS